MTAHASECEEADVGSLCDCDCAGARHAIRRTKGGVPGAGQVSKRAQKIAANNGRASVVNNRAVPSGRARRGPDLPPEPPPKVPPARKRIPPKPKLPRLDPPKPPEPDPPKPKKAVAKKPPAEVKTNTREPALAPTTAARAAKVREGLPKTRDDWHAVAAAQQTDLSLYQRQLDRASKAVDDANAQIDALYDKVAREQILPELLKQGGYRDRDDALRSARALAPHRTWDTPAYERLTAKLSAAQSDRFSAEFALKNAAATAYPVDKATGLRMPSPELTKHLEAVKDVGRAALADAKRQWERDETPQIVAGRDAIAKIGPIDKAVADLNAVFGPAYRGDNPEFTHPDGTRETLTKERMLDLHMQYSLQQRELAKDAKAARSLIAAHQANTIRRMLAEHREFGGATHTDVTPGKDAIGGKGFKPKVARKDWRKRLTTAEQHFPTDWVKVSAAQPLTVASSDRAYYSQRGTGGVLSMPAVSQDKQPMDGALDYADEVNVHEMGHRMETLIPGLTHLEFAYVRQRATRPDGTVERISPMAGYSRREVAQADKWGHPYAGKSYESRNTERPGEQSWEVFQTGLQDTFGRTSRVYGPTDDPQELQAFVIGALLTLG